MYTNCLTCSQGSVWFRVSRDLVPGPSASPSSRLLVSMQIPGPPSSVSDILTSLRATNLVGEEAK